MPGPAYLGLDVSQKEITACFLLASGEEPVPRWDFPNTQTSATSLADKLATLCQTHQVTQLRIGLEATSLYWWHIACFLKDCSQLCDFQPQVYALNPLLVHAYRENYGAIGKTDRLDAYLIADRIRWGRNLPPPFQVDLRYAPLQRLTRFRFHLSHALAREKTYFLTFLFLPFSGFAVEQPFGDHAFGATSEAVLEEFTTDDLAQQALPDLVAYLQAKGRGRFANPEEVAQALQRAARDSYRLDQRFQEPLRIVLATTMATIRTLQAQLQTVDRTIAQELKPIRQTLSSVPGLGPVFAAGLVAEIGDVHRFDNEEALAKFAGLFWKPDESGDFQGEDMILAKAGNAYLRYYLVEGANSVRMHCPAYQSYYQAKHDQSTKHHHQRALILTARKLVRLVYRLLRDEVLYHEPAIRQDDKEITRPYSHRPGRQQHVRRAVAIG